jgi:hypothetical protein
MRPVLELRLAQDGYVLGELVRLEVRVINTTHSLVVLHGADVWQGYLKVFIAAGGESYREYRGPGWGLEDSVGGTPLTLTPGDVHKTEATLLFNRRVDVDHLNVEQATRLGDARIANDYAFPKAGTYYVKAVLYDATFADQIESEPVVVTVVEPQGPDQEVWKLLVSEPELGYFIQTGRPRGHPREPRSLQLVETLEGIVARHPIGSYAADIQSALARYWSSVEELAKRGLI